MAAIGPTGPLRSTALPAAGGSCLPVRPLRVSPGGPRRASGPPVVVPAGTRTGAGRVPVFAWRDDVAGWCGQSNVTTARPARIAPRHDGFEDPLRFFALQ